MPLARPLPCRCYELVPGAGNVLLFNNGRRPDREWTTVDEFKLPETAPDSSTSSNWELGGFAQAEHVWSFGETKDHFGSFYCTHISGVQRLTNGNTMVTMGPQGIMLEVTPAGEEVWRYINPVNSSEESFSRVRQGDHRGTGRFSLFRGMRYAPNYAGLAGRDLSPAGVLEADGVGAY